MEGTKERTQKKPKMKFWFHLELLTTEDTEVHRGFKIFPLCYSVSFVVNFII